MFIGDADTCNLIEENSKYSADLIIRRPVTPDNLILRITRYFDDLNEAKERAEAMKLERRAAEEAKQAAIEAKVAENAATETEADAKKHILIVDDDRSVLKMLKSALGDTYEVTTMINGVMVDKLL